MIVKILLDVTRSSECNSAALVSNPTTSDRGQCATAYQVGNPPVVNFGHHRLAAISAT